MIKKWNNFINESNHNKSISLSENEMNLFSTEPALEELIASRKVTLKNGQVLYDENDSETRDLLDQYLEIPGKLEEKKFNESVNPISNRDFRGEISKIEDDIIKELHDTLDYCVNNDIFEKEYLNKDEYWYVIPNPIDIFMNRELDPFVVTNYQKEGDKIGKWVVPKGGYLLGDLSNNDYEMEVDNLDIYGMIDLLEGLKIILKNT